MTIYILATTQALTCVALGVLFWRTGQHRLAGAQFAYAFATIVLFAR